MSAEWAEERGVQRLSGKTHAWYGKSPGFAF